MLIAPLPTVLPPAEDAPSTALVAVGAARRPERPLILAVPIAAWLCFWGAPSALLAR